MRFILATGTCFVMLLAGFASTSAAALPIGDSVRATGDALKALRQGGYVLVLSHGTAATDEMDADLANLDTCASQRSLTDTGRLMASGIGKLLARERVRVGAILSSRYCRCIETAQRIAEQTRSRSLQQLDDLSEGSPRTTPAEGGRRTDTLRRLAGTSPAPRANTVIVTHRTNILEAFGSDFVGMGDAEMAIFKPASSGDHKPYRLVHRLTVKDLSAYAKAGSLARVARD